MIVDRIENGIAVCDTGEQIPLTDIGGTVREGDVLRTSENGAKYEVDTGETKKRREYILERFKRIKERNK